jgi:chemotaxis protein histidine kinase CheA
MFLAAHSIKGSAAMLELAEIRDLAHALEDVLGVLRDDRRPLERLTADVFFRAVDRLRLLLLGVEHANRQSTPETLALMSELAAGTTFATPPPQVANSSAAGVLLVEDSPTVRQVESFLLHDAGFVVDATGDAQEALAFARAMEYVLVIAGVETRQMRGPDLVRALRESVPGRPVPVLLTTTDFGPTSPMRSRDVVFAPKGKLDTDDFLHVVGELMLQAAA